MPTVTQLSTDMSHWPAGTHHYVTDAGDYLAVCVDVGIPAGSEQLLIETSAQLDGGIVRVLAQPTVIVQCDAEGSATSLDRLHTSPPGTSHADALAAAGYTVV
ncbi:DUF7572 family protein [Mycolicibacterium goodii]|uniref:DUF7572 family protein n=1 Tax=Mycolicibacterium goodii TaxID=134601 RepID=UPI001BDBCF2B|nr:hypothetical protein [Mycolicibacterium goodii]MBU8833381.1 hypothetical protein [Mycolicibacterium goodii]